VEPRGVDIGGRREGIEDDIEDEVAEKGAPENAPEAEAMLAEAAARISRGDSSDTECVVPRKLLVVDDLVMTGELVAVVIVVAVRGSIVAEVLATGRESVLERGTVARGEPNQRSDSVDESTKSAVSGGSSIISASIVRVSVT
jgi:hypothetical protein